MKFADLIEGEYYAATIRAHQVDFSTDRHFLHKVERVLLGYKVQYQGFDHTPNGAKMARVKCVARVPRFREWTEDNGDGTKTEWVGSVVSDDGEPVVDERSISALISPGQIVETWQEAWIQTEVRKINSGLEYHRDRLKE